MFYKKEYGSEWGLPYWLETILKGEWALHTWMRTIWKGPYHISQRTTWKGLMILTIPLTREQSDKSPTILVKEHSQWAFRYQTEWILDPKLWASLSVKHHSLESWLIFNLNPLNLVLQQLLYPDVRMACLGLAPATWDQQWDIHRLEIMELPLGRTKCWTSWRLRHC